MKKILPHILVLLFFLGLSAVVFRAGWGGDVVFSGSDANAGLLSQMKNSLPAAFCGTFSAGPLFGRAINHALMARTLILWLFPVQLVADLIYPFWLVVSSLALIAWLRLWGIGRLSSLFGALVAFWTGSITVASSGHMNKPAIAAFFVLALVFLEKSLRADCARRAVGYALLFGGAAGFMLLEQQDVGLYFAVFLGPYVLLRLIQRAKSKWKVWLRVLIPSAATALLIAGAPALQAYQQNVSAVEQDGAQSASEKWEFITQWSMVPAELPDLIAPGYTGWSTGNPDGPYWGTCGQSAEWAATRQGFQNFRLDSLYIGALPLLVALFGWAVAWKKRDERGAVMLFWGIAALAALWLSMGKFSPLYRLFYHLPMVNNVRAPIKFLHNFQIMAGILAAFGLHRLMEVPAESRRNMLVRWFPAVACAAGLLMLAAAASPSYDLSFTAWGQYGEVIIRQIRAAWVHGALMLLLAAAGLFAIQRNSSNLLRRAVPLFFAVLIAVDSLLLTAHYFKADDLGSLRRGDPVTALLRKGQGDGRVFLFSTDGIFNRWLAMEFPYYGIEAFNIWQMPRMPADYRGFLDSVGRDWKKMIDLASVRYAVAPAGVWGQIQKSPKLAEDFSPVMAGRVVASGAQAVVQQIPAVQQPSDMVVLKVNSSLPRLSLFTEWEVTDLQTAFRKLADPGFNPRTKVLVSGLQAAAGPMEHSGAFFQPLEKTEITSQYASGRVVLDRDGVVLFTQHFEPGWTVTVDDKPTELLRCNAIAMGVFVPDGDHTVRFSCPRQTAGLMTQAAGMLLALSGLLLIAIGRKDGGNDD